MDPGQMEGLMVNQFELSFQYVDGVKNIESRCIQQVAVIEISFYPGTDMSSAMAQVVSVASRAQASMPPNSLPPLILQMDAGSVPVGYLVFEAKRGRSARSATWPRTASAPWCRRTSPAPWRRRRSAATSAPSSSASIRTSCGLTT